MAIKGVFRFGGAILIGRVLQLLAFVALAHELSPAQMGVVGLLTAVFVGFHSLTNFGFDRYIVYADIKSSENIAHCANVIWTLQLIRGLATFLLSGLVAYFINRFSSFEVDIAYFFGIGAALLICNLMNPHVIVYEREGNFDYAARLRGVSATASGLSIMLLIMAWADPWVYVIGQVVNASVYSILTFRYSEVAPIMSFDRQVAVKVFGYCKHLLLMAVVSFAAVQFEVFFVGFMFDSAILGLYFTWARFVQLPREVFLQFSDRILFSRTCKLKREGGDFAKLHLLGLSISIFAIVPFYVYIWFHGDWLISVVAGHEWIEYWWAGKYFTIIGFLYLLSSSVSPFTLSLFPELASKIRTLESIGLIFLITWLGNAYNIEGVLTAALISMVMATIVRIYILYKKVIFSNRASHALLCILAMVLISVPLIAGELIASYDGISLQTNELITLVYCFIYGVGSIVLFKCRAYVTSIL